LLEIAAHISQMTDLNEERYERVVMEIQLHLVTERLPRCIGEHIRSQHLVDNIKRSHDGELLIHLRSVEYHQVRKTPAPLAKCATW
jgi:hypothetical protein